jgi:hypothetical protein
MHILSANLAVIGATFVGFQIHVILAYYNGWDYVMKKLGFFLGFYGLPLFIWLFTSGLILFLILKFPIDDRVNVLSLLPSIILSAMIIYIPVVLFLFYPRA